MKLYLLLSIFAVFSLQGQNVLREGYIIKIDTPKSLTMVERIGDSLTLRPVKGNKFIVINVILSEGRSLGKYDYVLKAANKTYKCKLISSSTEAFNEINWEFHVPSKLSLRWKSEPVPALSGSRTVKEGTGIRLMFEVNEKLTKAQLIYAMAPLGMKADEVSASAELVFN